MIVVATQISSLLLTKKANLKKRAHTAEKEVKKLQVKNAALQHLNLQSNGLEVRSDLKRFDKGQTIIRLSSTIN